MMSSSSFNYAGMHSSSSLSSSAPASSNNRSSSSRQNNLSINTFSQINGTTYPSSSSSSSSSCSVANVLAIPSDDLVRACWPMDYEEDDRSLIYSLHGDSAVDTRQMILLNLRKSMAEHVRQKLKERLHRLYDDFMQINQTFQDDSGKLISLECEVASQQGTLAYRSPTSTDYSYKVVIVCKNPVNEFFVYHDDEAMRKECTLIGFSSLPANYQSFLDWLNLVNSFGVSGKCSSLTCLFQFAFSAWKSTLGSATIGGQFAESEDKSIVQVLETATFHMNDGRFHSVIDCINDFFKNTEVSALNSEESNSSIRSFIISSLELDPRDVYDAIFLRYSAYCNIGMFSLALRDADILIDLDVVGRPSDSLCHKAVVLEKLQRRKEALDLYVEVLETDPGHPIAIEKFSSVFDIISGGSPLHENLRIDSPTSPTLRPRSQSEILIPERTPQQVVASGNRRQGTISRGRVRTESVPETVTSGTTASRWSSRSTTPTSRYSEVESPHSSISRTNFDDSLMGCAPPLSQDQQ